MPNLTKAFLLRNAKGHTSMNAINPPPCCFYKINANENQSVRFIKGMSY